jgi:hypothetical protein
MESCIGCKGVGLKRNFERIVENISMSHFEHGAIDKQSKQLVDPQVAAKRTLYECPGCTRDVFVRKGEIKIPHFAHKKDKNATCTYYNRNPSKDQQHRNAQLKLKQFLERGVEIEICRICIGNCGSVSNWGVNYTPGSIIKLEHSFKYNDSTKKADVVFLHDGKIIVIFEVVHTHFTKELDRPEPWHEISAAEINKVPSDSSRVKLTCLRQKTCKSCIERQSREERLRIERQIEYNKHRIEREREQEIRFKEWVKRQDELMEQRIKLDEEKRIRREKLEEEKRIQDEQDYINTHKEEIEYQKNQELIKQQRLKEEERKQIKVLPKILQQRERSKIYERELNRITNEVPKCSNCKSTRCTKCNHIIGPIWVKFKNEELPKIFADHGLDE